MSDDDFWDIDQYLTTRRNREIGAERMVNPVRPAAEMRAYDASAERVEPIGRDLPKQGKRQRRQPRDIAEIHGLDEAEISGNVRDVLADLVQEIGLLHDDLRLAEARIEHLEQELRHDLLGDWLDRMGFIGRLSRLMTLDQQEGVRSAVILVRLEGFAMMRRRQGWSTADSVISDLGGRLTRIQNAVVGHLSDDLFGVLLVGLPADAVENTIGVDIPQAISVPGPDPALRVSWAALDARPGQGELDQLSSLERKLARQSEAG